MKLKSIKIFGFKSFPEAVTLKLEGSLIGLVGPNGCGKSNLVDAIRFAMGEQSIRSLRAEKIEDLLFAGNLKRKALSLAEVTLQFEDCEPHFPMSELSIGRRIFRDGHSEYLINGKVVRLKEVERIFLGSGIGKNAFCLFEQGKLDEMIRLNPKDRRAIFEETAGISRFLEQRKESNLRLIEMKNNFLRLSDQHEGKKQRIGELKKQADLARAFLEKKKREKELSRSLCLIRYREASDLVEKSDLKLADLMKEEEKLRISLQSLDEKLTGAREGEKREREECFSLERELQELESALHVKGIEEKKVDEKIVSHLAWEKNIADEKREISLKKAALQVEIKEREKSLQGCGEKKKILEEQIQKINQALILFETQEKEMSLAKNHLYEATSAVEKASFALKEKRLNLDHKVKRSQELNLRINEKKQEEESFAIALERKREEKKALHEKIERAKKEQTTIQETLSETLENLKEKSKELETLRFTLIECEAKKNSLLSDATRSASFALLEEAKSEKSPFFEKIRPLQDLLSRPHPLYEETLLVESKEEAKELLDFAKKKNISDFSLALLEWLPEDLESYFFGDLSQVSSHGQLLSKKRAAYTEEGDFCDAKGVLFFFSKKRITIEKEKKKIDEKIRALSSEIKEKKELLEAEEKKKKELEKQKSEKEESRRRSEVLHFEINFHLSQGTLEQAKKKEIREKFASELKELSLEIEVFLKEIQEAEKHLDKCEKEKRQKEGVLSDLEEKLSQRKKLLENLNAKKQEERALLLDEARNQERFSNVTREETETELLLQKKSEQLEKVAQEKTLLQEEKKALSKAKEALLVQREEKKEVLSQKRKTNVRKKERESLEGVIVKERRRQQVLIEEKNKEEKAKILLTFKKEEREKEFSNRFEEAIESAQSTLQLGSEELCHYEEELATLRQELQISESLNFSSIEELSIEEEGFAFLEREYLDLKMAKEDLEKLIATLEKESRERFKATFHEIRLAFQRNFSLLFGGGRADLILLEGEELSAGVEIVVEPPGQKLRQISLLSGGERCLSALALLFALFEIRPAPFCLMDEVDAPLDETNIGRFTNLLSQFISKTQFLLVTHNKKTMAMADLLVGVTMEEKGVSKILSLEFERETAEAAL